MVKKNVCGFCILAHFANMSHFQSALSSLLSRTDLRFSAGALADACGIHRGDFSRLRAGKKSPTREIIQKLTSCDLLAPAEARNLLIAHLRDEVPESMAAEVEIQPAPSSRLGDGTAPSISDPLSEALDYMRARALKEPEFAEFLIGFQRMMPVQIAAQNG